MFRDLIDSCFRYEAKDNATEGRCTEKKMIRTLKKQKIIQPIIYPVRADLAAYDIQVIKSLLEKRREERNSDRLIERE